MPRENGYARVTPYLLYADVAKALVFLEAAFGFVEIRDERMTDEEGRIRHAAVRVVDQVVMLGCPDPEFAGPDKAGVTVNLYVYVDDVDAHRARAANAGATITTEPEQAEYGDRRYSATDTEGHSWWFAS